ncbi:MAG: hypothetical protein WA177_13235 [Xanthobacteraceae bacterium]
MGKIAIASQTLYGPDPVIPFAPKRQQKLVSSSHPLDTAGHALLGMVQQAAGIAEAHGQELRDVTAQFRAAEDQIKQLEHDGSYYRDRAERAEKWFLQISAEIERRFFGAGEISGQPQTRQNVSRALGLTDHRP